MSMKPSMVFVDIESTGLNPSLDVMLELAMVVTDDNLRVIAEKSMIVQPAVMPIWSALHPAVFDMHTANGLIAELEKEEGVVAAQVEEDFIVWLDEQNATSLPMVGNNVANFDRPFLRVHMGALEQEFHYRNIDISTVKELCRRYNEKVFKASPKEQPGVYQAHRALADCHASIAELDFYLEEFVMVDLA